MKTERENRTRPASVRNLQRMKSCAAGVSCLLALCLVGCDRQKWPSAKDAGIRFPVKSIRYLCDSPDMTTVIFSYENGRMTGMNDDGDLYSFNENPLGAGEKDDRGEMEYKNIKLNDKGFIASCDMKSKYTFEGMTNDETGQIKVEYDTEGHCVRIRCQDADDEDSFTETVNYTWKNGNLMKVSSYTGEELIDYYEYEYDEGRYPNPGVWDFYADLTGLSIDDLGIFPAGFYYAGWLGKPSKNIPVALKHTCYYNEEQKEESHACVLEGVDYNDDGSVSSIRSLVMQSVIPSTGGIGEAGTANSTISFGY